MHTRTALAGTAALLSFFLVACSGPGLVESVPYAGAGAPPSVGSAGSAGSPSSAGAPSYAAGGSPSSAFGGSAGAAVSTPIVLGSAGTSSAGASSAGAGGANTATLPPTNPPSGGMPNNSAWSLVWSDDFNATDGTAPDSSKWQRATGGDGWGNQELEYYTSDSANSVQRGGNLVVTATAEGAGAHSCWNGACQFTSARLLTSGKFSAAYGRVEARIKVPIGKGVWPAFWMLGDNIGEPNIGWPTCGEIDIMETIGSDSATLHGSLHGPGYSGGSPLTAVTKLPNGAKLSDDFHMFAVEWAPDSVKFFLDDALYETRTPADIPSGTKWVYNHPFFIILNVAVGGQWPGSPDQSTPLPAQMLVDYVRVYKAK